MIRTGVGLLALTCLLACPAPGPVPVDAGVVPDAGPVVDPTVAIFSPTHVVQVAIELPPADWDSLRFQTRDLFTMLLGDCTAQPFPSPFTTFEGTVTVDGQRLTRATVKKKGFLGSLSSDRPSLKLKFDTFIAGQEVTGLDSMTLNNAQQDPSIVRQCLGYAVFAKAGLVAPRCNYAHVRVNGADLGVYVHVEAIDKDFLKRRFTQASGHLYEGTLSDFSANTVRTFDLKGTDLDRSDVLAVTAALTAAESELVARLEPLVDLTQFIDFWATETVLRNWDGYSNNTNNFFIYDDPSTGKFVFIPWGVDAVLAAGAATEDFPEGLLLRGELARRLYQVPEMRARYLARVRSLLDTVFSEAVLRGEVTRMASLVRSALTPIQAREFAEGILSVQSGISGRRATLLAALASPPTGAPPPKPPLCLTPIGTVAGTFETSWGTLNVGNPFTTGSGTLDVTVDGGVIPIRMVGSVAGRDMGGAGGARVGVTLAAFLGDGGIFAAALRLDPALYPSAGPMPFDIRSQIGVTYEFQGQTPVPQGLMGKGSLEFFDAGMSAGAAVSGRFSADLFRWPFGG